MIGDVEDFDPTFPRMASIVILPKNSDKRQTHILSKHKSIFDLTSFKDTFELSFSLKLN